MASFKDEPKGIKKVMQYDKQFYGIFGTHVNHFIEPVLASIGIYSFDIVAFDEWVQKKNAGQYRVNKESTSMFVERLYGKEAQDLIRTLIKII